MKNKIFSNCIYKFLLFYLIKLWGLSINTRLYSIAGMIDYIILSRNYYITYDRFFFIKNLIFEIRPEDFVFFLSYYIASNTYNCETNENIEN